MAAVAGLIRPGCNYRDSFGGEPGSRLIRWGLAETGVRSEILLPFVGYNQGEVGCQQDRDGSAQIYGILSWFLCRDRCSYVFSLLLLAKYWGDCLTGRVLCEPVRLFPCGVD